MAARILITYPFPLGKKNGGARMTREIARNLGLAGARVTVLPISATPGTRWPRPAVPEEDLGFEFDAGLAEAGVDVVRVPQHPWHWLLDARRLRTAVGRILARERVDLSLSYWDEAAGLPSLLRRHGVKMGFIATWQSYARGFATLGRALPGPLGRWLAERRVGRPYREADLLLPTSRFTGRELMEVLGVDEQRLVPFPLGVEPRFLALPRVRPERVTRLLFFGRLTRAKGLFDALEALGTLAREGVSGWTFRIHGQGDQAAVREAAARAGIVDRVEIRDAVSGRALDEALTRAHVAVLPSYFEAFGLAFAEAQASGLPVVGYDAGSVPEVVANGVSGWLAPVRDVGQLTEKLRFALEHPEAVAAAGLAGRERVGRLFRWENTARTILGALEHGPLPATPAAASVS